MLKVKILEHTPNPEKVIACAGKLCYSPVGIDELQDNLTEENINKFIKRLMSLSHESPLEHISFTFAIEGVSRSLTHQLVRHRIASYCLSGDTVVFSDMSNREVKKRTIEEIYNMKPQYIKNMKLRCVDVENNIITENGIKSVVYSGEKEVFEVTTVDGYKIKSTMEHKFYTPFGWKRLKELSIRDEVYTNGLELYKDKLWLEEQYIKNNFSQEVIGNICGVSKHTIRSWVKKFNLQKPIGSWSVGVEPPNKGKTKEDYKPMKITSEKMMGNMNSNNGSREQNHTWGGDNITISGHYSRVNRYYTKVNMCKVCGCKDVETEIHHIDFNPNNSKQENLIEVCLTCHKVLHKGATIKHVKISKIKSIKRIGVEKTYDIEMFDPHHNFIANGFVVHNSQQSQRYVNLEDSFKYVTPKDIKDVKYINQFFEETMKESFNNYCEISRSLLEHYIYNFLIEEKDTFCADTPIEILEEYMKVEYKKEYNKFEKKAIENARAVLPNACETKIIVTMNMRSLLNFFAHRCCDRSQDEIRELAKEMLKKCREISPLLFNKVGASCVNLGYCLENNMSCGKFPTKNQVLKFYKDNYNKVGE